MSEKDKPRWVEMTHQTFVKDEDRGKLGERRFVEPVSQSNLTFQNWGQRGETLFTLSSPTISPAHTTIYRRPNFKYVLDAYRLPKLRGSQRVAKSVQVKRT